MCLEEVGILFEVVQEFVDSLEPLTGSLGGHLLEFNEFDPSLDLDPQFRQWDLLDRLAPSGHDSGQ